jgi:CheY-like chemotaxis protein
VAPSPSDKSRLILVAEDNEDNLELVTEYLAATGFTTITARDGHEALALAQTEHPALILMDIQMPNLNGLDAIRLVRQLPDPQVALVPVVAVTALAMPGDRELCLEAGFTDYIAKPITLHHLTELIERLLSTVPAT